MNENQSKIQYVADGNSIVFETPFSIYIKTGVEIYLEDELLSSDNYVVELDEQRRAIITFNYAPIKDTLITINRVLPVVRTSQFQEGGALRANTLNYEFDYQMACLQDVSEIASRSMSYPPYAVGGDVDLTLPSPEAGKSIMWSADGSKLENSNVLVNELEETLKDYKQEAEASAIIAQTAANNATEKSIEVAIKADEVSSAVDGKANVNLDNVNQEGISIIIKNFMPDYNNGVAKLASTEYIAETNGWLHAQGAPAIYESLTITINGETLLFATQMNVIDFCFIPIAKGDVYSMSSLSGYNAIFYPARGDI